MAAAGKQDYSVKPVIMNHVEQLFSLQLFDRALVWLHFLIY